MRLLGYGDKFGATDTKLSFEVVNYEARKSFCG
jgi:hypothetical protein